MGRNNGLPAVFSNHAIFTNGHQREKRRKRLLLLPMTKFTSFIFCLFAFSEPVKKVFIPTRQLTRIYGRTFRYAKTPKQTSGDLKTKLGTRIFEQLDNGLNKFTMTVSSFVIIKRTGMCIYCITDNAEKLT